MGGQGGPELRAGCVPPSPSPPGASEQAPGRASRQCRPDWGGCVTEGHSDAHHQAPHPSHQLCGAPLLGPFHRWENEGQGRGTPHRSSSPPRQQDLGEERARGPPRLGFRAGSTDKPPSDAGRGCPLSGPQLAPWRPCLISPRPSSPGNWVRAVQAEAASSPQLRLTCRQGRQAAHRSGQAGGTCARLHGHLLDRI